MELSNIITVIVCFAIIVVPIWYFMQSSSKKRKNRANKVAKLTNAFHLNFTESDHWDNIVLGIDQNTGKLLWFREANDKEEHKLVDLTKMGQSKKVNIIRDSKVNKERMQVHDQVGLELLPKGGTDAPVLLDFYNSDSIFLLSTQLELQEKWHKLINAQLAKNN